MNVRSMHIEIQQSTQQVAANRGRKWLPGEIDWILNKMQERFISSCLRPKDDGSGGFELDQVKADHIRVLVTTRQLTAYIADGTRYKCFLPGDYRNLLGDWSYTKDMCGAALPAPVSDTLYVSSILQHASELANGPYYEELQLEMPGISLDLADIVDPTGSDYAGYPEVKDSSFLVPVLLWHGNRQADMRWEEFDGQLLRNRYITVRTSAPVGAIAMTLDGESYADGSTTTRVLTRHTATGTAVVNNRLCATDIIPSLNQSRYYRSSHYSPISELQGTNLLIHRNDSFLVAGVGISYIRKPRPISLSLDSDCELGGEDTHQAICDLATEYIKGTVQNVEGKQLKTSDIAERVTL